MIYGDFYFPFTPFSNPPPKKNPYAYFAFSSCHVITVIFDNIKWNCLKWEGRENAVLPIFQVGMPCLPRKLTFEIFFLYLRLVTNWIWWKIYNNFSHTVKVKSAINVYSCLLINKDILEKMVGGLYLTSWWNCRSFYSTVK